MSTGKVADGWVDCSVPIHRDCEVVRRRGAGGDRSRGDREKERRSTYPCFHTGGTSDARYGASRPALAAPCTPMRRVNCPARYRAARHGTLYARERRIVYTVVPYRWSYCSPRRGPHMQPVAYQCARLYLPRRATTRGSPSSFFFSSLIFYSSSSFFLLGGASRPSSAVTFAPSRSVPPCTPVTEAETRKREDLRTRKLRCLGLKNILILCVIRLVLDSSLPWFLFYPRRFPS